MATRNCLVAEVPALGLSDRLHIQLCDAALSRDIFSDDYYIASDAQDDTSSRPVKWMGPEALRSNVFNSASDVVSHKRFIKIKYQCCLQSPTTIYFLKSIN